MRSLCRVDRPAHLRSVSGWRKEERSCAGTTVLDRANTDTPLSPRRRPGPNSSVVHLGPGLRRDDKARDVLLTLTLPFARVRGNDGARSANTDTPCHPGAGRGPISSVVHLGPGLRRDEKARGRAVDLDLAFRTRARERRGSIARHRYPPCHPGEGRGPISTVLQLGPGLRRDDKPRGVLLTLTLPFARVRGNDGARARDHRSPLVTRRRPGPNVISGALGSRPTPGRQGKRRAVDLDLAFRTRARERRGPSARSPLLPCHPGEGRGLIFSVVHLGPGLRRDDKARGPLLTLTLPFAVDLPPIRCLPRQRVGRRM
jgi:hypothetical protein